MSERKIQHFLIVYDIGSGKAAVEPFGNDYAEAVRRYASVEQEYRGNDNFDVVLLGSDSYETLARTHSSYFELGRRHADSIVRAELAELGLV